MTLVIAHRGDRARAPENTLRAFELAIEAGADWIEMDLRLTADDRVAVLHDAELGRLTGEAALTLESRLADLERLVVLGGGGGPDEHVPSLEAVLARIGPRVPLYLEIKTDATPTRSVERLVDRCLERVPESSPHALASFDPRVVARGLDAGRRTILIADRLEDLAAVDRPERLFALSLRHDAIDPVAVARCADLGVGLWAWTVDREGQWERLRGFGADQAWCTNDPLGLRQWLGREDGRR